MSNLTKCIIYSPRAAAWGWREPFTPSEAVAIAKALEPKLTAPRGRPSKIDKEENGETFPIFEKGNDKRAPRTRDKLASYVGMSGRTKKIADILSVSYRTASEWTKRARKDRKEEENAQILDLWFRCYSTAEIAKTIFDDPSKYDTVQNRLGKIAELQKFPTSPVVPNSLFLDGRDSRNSISKFGETPESNRKAVKNSRIGKIDNLSSSAQFPFPLRCMEHNTCNPQYGLPLTRKEKRRVIEEFLKLHPERSNSWLAEDLGTTVPTIGKIREELEAKLKIKTFDTLVTKDGKTYPRTIEQPKREFEEQEESQEEPETEKAKAEGNLKQLRKLRG